MTIDHLGEDTLDLAQATATRDAYLALLDALGEAGLTESAEVSVKLSAVGQALPGDGEKIALENARAICEKAAALGTTVTLDMEDHTTTDSTLGILRELRQDFPGTGARAAGLPAPHRGRLPRPRDRGLAGPAVQGRLQRAGDRRLRRDADEVDRAYVRCMKILMQGEGYPMLATHDPRLVEIGGALAVRNDRAPGSYEFQMLYGIRPDEQQRLADQGERMRVYVPYGDEWYGYLVRRLAEKPTNLSLLARALVSKG